MTKVAKSLTGETKIHRSDMKYATDFVVTEFVLAMVEREHTVRTSLTAQKALMKAAIKMGEVADDSPVLDQKLADVAVAALVGIASRRALRLTPSTISQKSSLKQPQASSEESGCSK